MSEKKFNTRVIQKHDTEANWSKASFIPKKGEIIIYDIDSNYTYERIKIGDGVKSVNALPFVTDALEGSINGQITTVSQAVLNVASLVGNTSVSEQIDGAINNITANDFGVYVQSQEPINAVAGDIWIDTANDPSYIPPTLPEITEVDNGKVLMVVNGRLQLVNMSLSVDANGVVSI